MFHATLDSVHNHESQKAQYITQIKEALQKVHDPRNYNRHLQSRLIYDVKVIQDKVVPY